MWRSVAASSSRSNCARITLRPPIGRLQHRLVQHHPQLRPVRRTKTFLPCHAGGEAFLQLLLTAECQADAQHRTRISSVCNRPGTTCAAYSRMETARSE